MTKILMYIVYEGKEASITFCVQLRQKPLHFVSICWAYFSPVQKVDTFRDEENLMKVLNKAQELIFRVEFLIKKFIQ